MGPSPETIIIHKLIKIWIVSVPPAGEFEDLWGKTVSQSIVYQVVANINRSGGVVAFGV